MDKESTPGIPRAGFPSRRVVGVVPEGRGKVLDTVGPLDLVSRTPSSGETSFGAAVYLG